MTTAGTIFAGLALICLAGVFNGSWNASFSPQLNLAVGKWVSASSDTAGISSVNDLTYHHSFALFQVYAALINIPICIFWAGGIERVGAILAQTPASSIGLVVLFSVIWGLGTVLFGLACKIAGVGLGTNLSMGIIAVIGTFLPLITEKTLASRAGAVICAGLIVCCCGLWLSTKALAKRDEDDYTMELRKKMRSDSSNNEITGLEVSDKGTIFSSECQGMKGEIDVSDVEGSEEVGTLEGMIEESDDAAIEHTSPAFRNLRRSSAKIRKSRKEREQVDHIHPTWMKIGVCIATGICAVQLQFAFIFGQPITDLALENDDTIILPGSTHKSGGAAIIWLLAISLGAPVAIINGIYSSPVPLSSAVKTPLSRHLKLICSTSIPWISHIHIYGVCATVLLPSKVAASIGWPMLMMVTSGQALLLSVFLGEWKSASEATIRILKYSLGTTVIGIAILMSSVAE